jgi:TorA maturation chaperone TorD
MSHQELTPIALLAQADLVLLVADWLRPPGEARQCHADVQAADLAALVEAAGLPESSEVLSSLLASLEGWRHASSDEVSDEYHRLFEGAMVCPLNETTYIRRDKGAILGDLAGYYRAFGWTPTGCGGEKADHLLTELEFAATLLSMAARAQAERLLPEADVTREALASFASDHLNDWLVTVCQRIAESTTLALYADSAKAIARVWYALVELHGWPVVPSPVAAALPEEEDWSLECGAVCMNAAGQGHPSPD